MPIPMVLKNARAATIVALCTISAAVPAQAQRYDPNYPVCLQVFGRQGDYIACGYTSMPQCQMSASGRAAQCIVNPFFRPTEPAYRAQRRARRRR